MSDTNKHETIDHTEEEKDLNEERREGEVTQEPEWFTKEVAKIRKNKQEEVDFLTQKISDLESKLSTTETKTEVDDEVVAKVKLVLEQERKAQTEKEREENLATALENYKQTNKLFHEDNDPEGAKFAVIKEQLKEFNLSGASSIKDFESYINKAVKLVGVESTEEKEETFQTKTTTPFPGTHVNAKSETAVSLSKEDVAKADSLGMKHERFLELKKKYPERF